MTVDIRPFPRHGWDPLPGDGVVGVVGRVLVHEDDFFVAQLRFTEHATIHEHPGERDAIVVCVEGEGYTSVGDRPCHSTKGSRFAGRRAFPIVCGPRLNHVDAHDRVLRLISPPETPRDT